MRPILFALLLLIAASPFVRAESAGTDPAVEMRLKKARETFTKTVDVATRRLREAYDAAVQAYTRAGNLDQALATRKARDAIVTSTTRPSFVEAEQPEVEAGWTVLFRSADPLVWNIYVHNATMTAAPVSAASKEIRYLRMRRMDTGDAVIIPCTFKQLTSRSWPIAQPTFRGDRCLVNNGRELGIVDPRAPVDPANCPFIDVTPDGHLSGWGFAVWQGNREPHQALVWDSKVIPPTAIEISVTANDLSPDEQHLLVGP